MSDLSACPMCAGKASVRRNYDPDGCMWAFVECDDCGLRTRGDWVSVRGDACPIFYAGVRDAWNNRTPKGAES